MWRGLQGTDLVTVDEDEAAVVELDSPPPSGARDPIRTDIDGLPRTFPEVLDDYTALLLVCIWKNDDRSIYPERIARRSAQTVDSLGHMSPLSTRPPRPVEHVFACSRRTTDELAVPGGVANPPEIRRDAGSAQTFLPSAPGRGGDDHGPDDADPHVHARKLCIPLPRVGVEGFGVSRPCVRPVVERGIVTSRPRARSPRSAKRGRENTLDRLIVCPWTPDCCNCLVAAGRCGKLLAVNVPLTCSDLR